MMNRANQNWPEDFSQDVTPETTATPLQPLPAGYAFRIRLEAETYLAELRYTGSVFGSLHLDF